MVIGAMHPPQVFNLAIFTQFPHALFQVLVLLYPQHSS